MSLLADYLTREELAKELRVTPRTINRWRDMPDGIPCTEIGGRVLYRRAAIEQWLKAHERQPNPRRKAA
jgi:excisionase family DNA binding protein